VSLQTFCLLNVCEKTFFKILPQMYCFSTRLPTSMSVTVKPSIICLSVWCYSLFKLLQSLPTTQHIYELSLTSCPMFVTTCSTEFWKWKKGLSSLLLRWLTWKGLLWDGRWCGTSSSSTFESDLFEATKNTNNYSRNCSILSKKVRHTPTVHKICIVNQPTWAENNYSYTIIVKFYL
jgi:hypothetical protein